MRTLPLQTITGPIRGLNLPAVTRQIEGWRNGYLAEFAQTAEMMEERDELLKNVVLKRRKAVSRHDWEVVACDDSVEAREHQAALVTFYENLSCGHALREDQEGGISLLVFQMLDALAKGWAVHEITWVPMQLDDRLKAQRRRVLREVAERSRATVRLPAGTEVVTANAHGVSRKGGGEFGLTARFRFIPLWFFEHTTRKLRFAPRGLPAGSEELKRGEWLVTTTESLMLACARAYVFKHLPLQAWLDYCQKFGTPALRGVTGAARNTADWDDMVKSLETLMEDLTVVTNSSESIEVIDLKGHGSAPFAELVERMDRMMAAVWRGADLSTISRDKGYGASLQEEESRILEVDDAQLVSETLNKSVDRWVIHLLFGEEVHPRACFKLLVPARSETAQDLAVDRFLIEQGAKLSMADMLRRYGRAAARVGGGREGTGEEYRSDVRSAPRKA